MNNYIDILEEEFNRFIVFGAVLDKKTRTYFVSYLKRKTKLYFEEDNDFNEHYFKLFAKSLDQLFASKDLQELFDISENLSAQVALDILYWFRKNYARIAEKHPYQDEVDALENWSIRPIHKLANSWKFMLRDVSGFYIKQEFDISFYESKFQNLYTTNWESNKELLDFLINDFLASWDALLQTKILLFQLKNLEEALLEFKVILDAKASEFAKLSELIKPFAAYGGSYWDMSRSLWQSSSFDIINLYNEHLKDEKVLQRLADLLGKLREAEIEIEEEKLESIIVNKAWKKDENLRSEISGIRTGDDLNNLLGSEIALFSEHQTTDVFLKNYAEKSLLQLAYQDSYLAESNAHSFESHQRSKLKEKGPFIICVDTSGSMEGDAEHIAKVLSFGIMKMAAQTNRKAYLINFSSGVKTINLQDIAKSLDSLAKFLSFSFHGGTDISLALQEALKQLNENDYKEADVLIISDFIMYKIDDEVLEKMSFQQQQRGTQFHSLIISDSPNTKIIESFDNVWQYDPNTKGIVKEIYKDILNISSRMI